MRTRVRGIYATALTRLFLDADHDVVQASPPIRNRFDADFGTGDCDVNVETTDDRQGVGVTGPPDDAAAATDILADVGIDTLAWTAVAPDDAVFDGRVVRTLGSGAVVDLGDAEGFLPFDAADGYVDEGDDLRVQVRRATSPWSDDRPELSGYVRTNAGLATLERGRTGVTVDTYDDAAGRELAGMTELLDADAPDGWGVRWAREATDADMSTLSRSLDSAAERAGALDDALGEPVAAPRAVAKPVTTTWVWFGRASRFELDAVRRRVATTMPGHHRTKAASADASAGVDFAEALCEPEGEFPFDVVTRQFGPTEGDEVEIGHGKPDGRLFVLGRGQVVERDADGTLSVRREMSSSGTYDGLGTSREAGDVALTKFREGRWWYPTVYRSAEGDRKGTYVNVCTPVECFPGMVRYVDLHVDVVKRPNGGVERVDDDELDAAVEAGEIPNDLAEKARSVASSLENAL